jgi:hypothetical protein
LCILLYIVGVRKKDDKTRHFGWGRSLETERVGNLGRPNQETTFIIPKYPIALNQIQKAPMRVKIQYPTTLPQIQKASIRVKIQPQPIQLLEPTWDTPTLLIRAKTLLPLTKAMHAILDDSCYVFEEVTD